MPDRDSRKQKKLNRIEKRWKKPTSNKKRATRDLRRAEAIENDRSLSSKTRSYASGVADDAAASAFNISPGNNSFNQDVSRQGKKLNRIEKRSEKGFKSQKQAGRNFDRLEKITKETSGVDELFNRYNRATTLADQVISQYDEFDDSSPANNSAPFYKTGCIDYNKK